MRACRLKSLSSSWGTASHSRHPSFFTCSCYTSLLSGGTGSFMQGSLQKHSGLSCLRLYFLCFDPAEITAQAQHNCHSRHLCLLTWTALPHLSQCWGTTLSEITMRKGETISPLHLTNTIILLSSRHLSINLFSTIWDICLFFFRYWYHCCMLIAVLMQMFLVLLPGVQGITVLHVISRKIIAETSEIKYALPLC